MPKPTKRRCVQCETLFKPHHHTVTICSDKCREERHKSAMKDYHRRKVPLTPKKCEVCKKPIVVNNPKGRGRKYHGDAKVQGSCAWKGLQLAIERQKQRREEVKKRTEELVHSHNSTHHGNLHHIDCPLCKKEKRPIAA